MGIVPERDGHVTGTRRVAGRKDNSHAADVTKMAITTHVYHALIIIDYMIVFSCISLSSLL